MLAMLRDLVAHKGHANAAVLRVIAGNPAAAADPDVWALLHHVLLANRFWLLAIRDEFFVLEDESRESDSFAALVARYARLHDDETAWLEAATEAGVERVVTGPLVPGGACTVAQALLQVCLHTHGHRAQCAKLLRRHGVTPPVTDFILWLTHREPAQWPDGAGGVRHVPDVSLPTAIADLVDELAAASGAVAVTLGGSRASGSADAGSDWDLGLYYRGALDLAALRSHGEVHPPGTWGRIMNGGAWLSCGGERVDVLLRDLDVVDHWTRRAQAGDFEVDALLGYTAGVPTYMLTAELACGVVLRGALDAVPYPPRLIETGPPRWRFCRAFSLEYARSHARRGNRIGALAQAAKAVFEEAHAILCARGAWVFNEKRMLDDAGLTAAQALFAQVPAADADLAGWIDRVAGALDVAPTDAVPWTDAGRGR